MGGREIDIPACQLVIGQQKPRSLSQLRSGRHLHLYPAPVATGAHLYYAGFRSNSSATFSVSSATSGGTIGTLPVLDFYTGTLNTSIPANSSVIYRIAAPVEATRLKWTSTHASTVQLRLEQGTLPASTGTSQHFYSTVANSPLNQALSSATWPWQPNQSYYLRIVNNAATAATVAMSIKGENAWIGSDAYSGWAPGYFTSAQLADQSITSATADPDRDGIPNLLEFLCGGNPLATGPSILPTLTTTPVAGGRNLVFTYNRKLTATGVTQVVEHSADLSAIWTPAVQGQNGVTIITTPVDASTEQVTVTIPSTSTSRFVRLKATR